MYFGYLNHKGKRVNKIELSILKFTLFFLSTKPYHLELNLVIVEESFVVDFVTFVGVGYERGGFEEVVLFDQRALAAVGRVQREHVQNALRGRHQQTRLFTHAEILTMLLSH